MEKQTIGGFLATLRKANGYTQQEVAEKIGVSNKTLSSWETDNTCPDLTLIPVLADLYGVTSDEILRAGRRRSETAEKEQAPEERAALNEKNIRADSKNKAALSETEIMSCAAFPSPCGSCWRQRSCVGGM